MDQRYPFHQREHSFARKTQGLIFLLVVIVATAWAGGGQYLMIRQLWMDEVHSWLIVTDHDSWHAMEALADGADFNPPIWFLFTRWLTALASPITELHLRFLSLTWMLLFLAGLYVVLSRVFVSHVCITAVLLTASHPLLIHQSTEIRFYGFWCASTVWLCSAILWQPATRSLRLFQMISVFGLTVTTTTCHYFGILSVFLLVLPLVFRCTHDRVALRLTFIIVVSSIASLSSCGHFLASQKAALSRPTWISPTTLGDSVLFVQALLPAWQILVSLAGLAISLTAAKRFTLRLLPLATPSDAARLLPCLCLTGMPLIIVLVAWGLQPALVTRYAIVGIAGFAPLFAIAVKNCSPRLQSILRVVSILGLGFTTGNCADYWIKDDVERMALLHRLSLCPEDSLIVFEDRIQFMPVLHLSPENSSRCLLAEFPDSDMAEVSTLRIVQRDAGRRIQKWYPQYGMLPIKMLAEESMFFVVPYAGGTSKDLAYPAGYSISKQSAGIFRFERTGGSQSLSCCAAAQPERRAVESKAAMKAAEKLQEML